MCAMPGIVGQPQGTPFRYRYGWDNMFWDLPPVHHQRIAQRISNNEQDVRELAGQLNITNDELAAKGVFNPTNRNPAYDVLLIWHQNYPETATIAALEVALKEINRHDIIQHLKKAMLDPFKLLVVVRGLNAQMECPVVGEQTLEETVAPELGRLGYRIDDVQIERPTINHGSSVTWETKSHSLKGQQVDLRLQENARRNSGISIVDTYGYCNIDYFDMDLRSSSSLTPRNSSMTYSLPDSTTSSFSGGSQCLSGGASGVNNLNRQSSMPASSSQNWSDLPSKKPLQPESALGTVLPEPPRYVEQPRRKVPEQHEDLSAACDQYLTFETSPENLPAYWPKLGQTKREIKTALKKQLKSNDDGHYIIRHVTDPSETNCKYAISITCNKRLKHFLIHEDVLPTGSKFYLFKDGHRASSIPSLVEYYKDMPLCPPSSAAIEGAYGETRTLTLKYPVPPPPKLEPLDEDE